PAHYASTLADYERGVFFLLAGLLAVVALLSKRVSAAAGGGIAIALTFANLWMVSREIQPVMDEDVYELAPKTLHAPFERMQPWQIYSTNPDVGQFFYGSRDHSAYQWGKDAAINNILQPYGLFQEHSVGLKLRRYMNLYGLLSQLEPVRQNRLADLMNIRYVVRSVYFEEVFWRNGSKEVQVVERPSCLPKAYVVDRFRTVPNFMEAVRTMLGDSFDPRREVVVEPLAGESFPELPPAKNDSAPGEVRRLHYQWNSVDLSVSAARPSLLVLTDTWFPGWKAAVNGKPVPIYQANGYFRAIPLPPGENEVVFTYRPWQFTVGWTVTAATLCLLLGAGAVQGGLAFYAWRSRKR
ncbi:MAG: YfhO family protein, partial [Chthoniobacteraceae bacterium]|nr:YfhO family protein [Chthoniobacteraceae bacterium]